MHVHACVMYCAGVYFLKWDDQSHFRSLFSMEWYVLGNGPFDYGAIHPDLASKTPPPGSQGPKGMFGSQYSGYPNETDLTWVPTASQRNQDDEYNDIDNWEKSVHRSLFTGKVDGQRFAPMRTDYGSTYASMVFRTADMRQGMFSWIYETAAGAAAGRAGSNHQLAVRSFVSCSVLQMYYTCNSPMVLASKAH